MRIEFKIIKKIKQLKYQKEQRKVLEAKKNHFNKYNIILKGGVTNDQKNKTIF